VSRLRGSSTRKSPRDGNTPARERTSTGTAIDVLDVQAATVLRGELV
jgi:hypothetical protein